MDDGKQKKHFSSKIQKVCSLPILAQNLPNSAQVLSWTYCLIFSWLRSSNQLKGSVYCTYRRKCSLCVIVIWRATRYNQHKRKACENFHRPLLFSQPIHLETYICVIFCATIRSPFPSLHLKHLITNLYRFILINGGIL